MEKRATTRHLLLRPLLVLLAVAFLIEAWVWQACVALGRRIVALIPWEKLKERIKAFIGVMPAPVALIIFLIPLAIVEPFKIISIWLVAVGHPILGVVGWIAMQFAGVGLVAVAFDLTREKLLSMPWFVWVYGKFHAFHDYAHALVAPYKDAALREMRALRDRARAYWLRLTASEEG
jgi:hypothetical protein